MPSIFIWKSDVPNNSKKMIRYYSGSSWALEDNETLSKSYSFLDQIVIPGFDDSVITYQAKIMPRDWIGSDLLEVSYIPFEHIKSDEYGTLDRIGNWMRFVLKKEIDFNIQTLQQELSSIQKWVSQDNNVVNYKDNTENTSNFEKNKDIKNKIYNKKSFHQNSNQSISINPETIQHNFQNFLIKYNFPLINHENNIAINQTNQRDNYQNKCNNYTLHKR